MPIVGMVRAPAAPAEDFRVVNRSGFMNGRTSCQRFSGVAIGVLLLVVSPAFPPRTARADERPEAKPISAELVTAIRNVDLPALRTLLENGADVNSRDAKGNTPLILASLYATPECVALLIENGADVNAANKAGATALIRAATDYEKTRLLVDAGANVRARTVDLGNTPLMLAARRAGNSRTVTLLLERGASVTERNNADASPIVAAAAGGDVEMVRLLLDAGAKANDFADTAKSSDFAASFRTPLMWAAYHNNGPLVRLLLERRADKNLSTPFGSPLSHACLGDSFAAAELLIARGANPGARDAMANFTPLHWAAGTESSRAELVELPLAIRADPNAVGGEPVGAFGLAPQTPRLIAEKRGRTAIVDVLAAAGARDVPRTETIAAPLRALPEMIDRATLIASTETALAALQATAARSRELFVLHVSKQDCVSCHQQYLPMAAVGHARNRSVRFDQEVASKQMDSLDKLTNPFFQDEYIVQTLFHPDPAHTFGYH